MDDVCVLGSDGSLDRSTTPHDANASHRISRTGARNALGFRAAPDRRF
jgi:hypothetical protein